jgi:hypothetical protein
MHHLRVLRRTLLLTAHVLLGLFLTVLLPARRSNGTRPEVHAEVRVTS